MNQPASSPLPSATPQRLFLVDGYGFVFRAFHAIRELTAPDGTPVNAIYGLTTMLLKLRQKLRPNDGDAMLVVLDSSSKSFRNDIYPAYKANRPPAPPELIPQFPLVREAIEAIGLPAYELAGFEADDIIATFARAGQRKNMEVVIVSSDKDLMQLIGGGITMLDAMKDKAITEKEVLEKFGVTPALVLDVLALMGDSSDNIPGVPGIGPKTAAELIGQFGGLDAILERAGEIKQNKRRETLQQFADQARLSRELARLKEDVPLEIDWQRLTLKEAHPEQILPFLQKMGFRSLMSKYGQMQEAAQGAAVGSWVRGQESGHKDVAYQELASKTELAAWLQGVKLSGTLAMYATKEGIALARAEGVAAWYPRESCANPSPLAAPAFPPPLAGGGLEPAPTGEGLAQMAHQADLFSAPAAPVIAENSLAPLLPYLADATILKVGYDVKATPPSYQLPATPYDDILVMSYTLDGARHSHALENLAQQHAGMMLGNEQTPQGYCAKADALLRLRALFRQRLFTEKMLALYETMERPLVTVLAAMEQRGIKVDAPFLHELSQEFASRLAALEQEIYALAGHEFTIGSPKQLGEVLFEEMGITGGKTSKKSGGYVTDASVLEELALQGHSIAQKVLDWRSLAKLRSTYTEALQREINPKTGRVHTTFAMAATTTGRLSSLHPNLQNIPIRTEEGRRIRHAFIAEKGNVLISADYSQIELRLLAAMAEIEPLKAAFLQGQDIHTKTASQVLGIPLAEVTGSQRRAAKAINFGIIYGQSAFGLAAGLGISREEAKRYIDAYFTEYPGIKDYMERTKAFAREHGYVCTLYGRKCYLPGINASGPQRAFAERAAINAPLQGTAADVIKKAMVAIARKLPEAGLKAQMVLQVHDELLLEAPGAEAETVMTLVKTAMAEVAQLSVPLTVEAKAGKNWGEIH